MTRSLDRIARELVDLRRQVKNLATQPRLPFSSIEGGYVQVRDDSGVVRQVIGAQSDGSVTSIDLNGAAPTTPATPAVSGASAGLLTITSYGLTADGSAWPLDLKGIEVHVSPSTGFTPSAATKVADFGRNGGVVSVALAAGVWYAALVAVNTSGVASPKSTEGSATVTAPATGSSGIATYYSTTAPTGTIADGSIWYDIDNDNLQSRYDLATTTWVPLTIGPNGLTTNILGGKKTPINSTTELSWGVPNPTTALGTPTYLPENYKTISSDGQSRQGLQFETGGNYIYFMLASDGHTGLPMRYDVTTNSESRFGKAFSTGTANKLEQACGIAHIGTNYWTLTTITDFSAFTTSWKLRKYDSSFNLLATYTPYGPDSSNVRQNYQPSLGSDGTNPLIGYLDPSTTKLNVLVMNPSTGAITSTITSTTSVGTGAGIFSTGVAGNASFDFGATRYLVCLGATLYSMTSGGVIQAAEGTVMGNNFGGLTWDGTRFATIPASRGFIGKLTTQVNSITRYAAYTWADINAAGSGTHETALSSATAALTVPPRLCPTWTPYTPPSGDTSDVDGADTTKLYMSSTGTAGSFHYVDTKTYPAGPIVGLPDLTGAAPPAATSFDPGLSGILQSKAGGFIARGDGTGAWPYLQAQFAKIFASISHNHDTVYEKIWSGKIEMTYTSSAPTGWLMCDGSFVNISDYPTLFSAIGHTANGGVDPGDGTFKLPDMRDRFPAGAGGAKALGDTGGADSVTMPDHQHNVGTYATDTFTHTVAANTPTTGGNNRLTGPAGHSHAITGTSGNVAGANPPISSIPKYHAVNYVIKI